MFNEIPIQSSYSEEMADTIRRVNKLKDDPDLIESLEENEYYEIYFTVDGMGDLLFFIHHGNNISSIKLLREVMYDTKWSQWILSYWSKKDDDGTEAHYNDAVDTNDLHIWHIDRLKEEDFINELETYIMILQF